MCTHTHICLQRYHKSCENVEQMFCSSQDYRALVVLSWEPTRGGLSRTCLVDRVMGLLEKHIYTWG